LPLPVDKFYPGTIWKLRVLNYNEDIGELITENMRYHFHDDAEFINDSDDKQIKNSFYFDGIEKIKFRSLNTASFLKSVILKKQNIPDAGSSNTIVKNEAVHENIILKTMKVPLAKVKFLYGNVSFPILHYRTWAGD
jgi:hypothetical protein